MNRARAVAGLVGLLGLVAAGCGSEAGGGAEDPGHPSWIVGSHANPGRETGDVDHSSSDGASLLLRPDGSYSYVGCTPYCSPDEGTWQLDGSTLSFTGFLSENRVDLTRSMSPDCRVLRGIDGNRLWRSDVVQDCPTPREPPTAAECQRIGSYDRSSHFDSTTYSSSDEDKITLYPDHFAETRHSTSRYQCSHDYSICVDSFTRDEPEVGVWRLTEDGVAIDGREIVSLTSYRFSPAARCGARD
jgi:hypothetical protein